MPIEIAHVITVMDQEAFHAVDRVVTGLAFNLHNEFGRYLDERLYRAAMADGLAAQDFRVVREMKMTLRLGGFRKEYYADFLVDEGVIVEMKTASELTNSHRAQVLNYLYMCGLRHGTLLNLRPERVQHEFVSTTLAPSQRRQIIWSTTEWKPLCSACERLRTLLEVALADWGARLDPLAYRDAIIHFLGGEAAIVREIEVRSDRGLLGRQRVCLLADDIGFSITASVHCPGLTFEHLRRFLHHTNLRAIQWVNLNGSAVTLQTILP